MQWHTELNIAVFGTGHSDRRYFLLFRTTYNVCYKNFIVLICACS